MTQRIEFSAPSLSVGFDLNGEGRNLKNGTLIDGSALRYIRKEGFELGPCGYRNIVSLGTSAKVDTLFGSKSQLSKSLWSKSGTKLFNTVQIEGKKYTVGLTLTTTERNFMIEAENGDIFTFNQIDAPARVATAALTADTASDVGVLTVGTGMIDKFAASGTVYVRGSPVTYSGKSGGTLTGLTGIPAGGVVTGDLLTQTTTPSTFAIAKGTCGMIVEGAMLVGGVKGFENVLYQSAPANDDNTQFLWDFTDNGATASILENPITAAIKGTSVGYIFSDSSIKATTGYDLTTNVLRIDDVTQLFGAYNPRCVANVGGRAFALGKNRLVPLNFYIDQSAAQKTGIDENFDTPIRPWIEQFDTDNSGHAFLDYNSVKGLVTIAGKIDGRLSIRRFDARDGIKLFTPEDVRPARCYTSFDGTSYFGNNSTDKVYIDNEGFTNDGYPIVHRARTSRMEAGKETLLDVLKLDGFMSNSCETTLNLYVNGNFDTAAYTLVIDDSFITSAAGQPIGNRTRGLFMPGGDTSEIPTLKFPFKADIDLTGLSGDDFSLEFIVTKLGAFLQLKSFIMEGDGIRFQSIDRF